MCPSVCFLHPIFMRIRHFDLRRNLGLSFRCRDDTNSSASRCGVNRTFIEKLVDTSIGPIYESASCRLDALVYGTGNLVVARCSVFVP